jgi:hypothetical protein
VALLFQLSLRRGIVQLLAQAILIAETVAAGDLGQELSTELQGDFGRLLSALGTMEDTLTELVGRIKQSADAIGVSAGEIDSGSGDLSRRTEEQVGVASMEQLIATVCQNAERALGQRPAGGDLSCFGRAERGHRPRQPGRCPHGWCHAAQRRPGAAGRGRVHALGKGSRALDDRGSGDQWLFSSSLSRETR